MIKIDLHSQAPLYEQIKTGFKGLVRRKLLRPGDAAPSIRALAAQLTLNPNTVIASKLKKSVDPEASRLQAAIDVLQSKLISR